MSLWKERFHFVSGLQIEGFEINIDESKYEYPGKWLKVDGDDENSFILINLENVECIEFKEV